MGWGSRVSKALKRPEVRKGIAAAVATYAQQHIEQGAGRGRSGTKSQFAPLANMTGRFWTFKKPRNQSDILDTREVPGLKKVKDGTGHRFVMAKLKQYLVVGRSYRAGGQPLRDTGRLLRSLSAKAKATGPTKVSVVLRGEQYGIYHEKGFKTSGPNYIPLTKKGKRKHQTGSNPETEDLVRGKDFTMAWNGVTVPARPFLVPTNAEFGEIGRTIKVALAQILKGRAS